MTNITRFARDIHYLYPEVIYRFSAMFLAFWESYQLKSADIEDGENKNTGDALVIPAFFSKKTRTFHWVGMHHSMWNWDKPETKKMLKNLLDELIAWRNDNDSLWTKFLDDMPEEIDIYKKAGDLLTRLTNSNIKKQDYGNLHRAILTLYSGYHQHAEKNIEGVYYRFLKKCNNHHELDYLLGKLQKENEHSDSFDWFLIDPHCCGNTNCLAGKWQSLHDENCSGDKKPAPINIQKNPLSAIADNILLKWLLLAPKDFGERLGKHPDVIVTPIHDVVVGGRGYGGIKGVIVLFFNNEKTDKRADWIINKYKTLVSTTPELAGEISASAGILAESFPITPPYDLLNHFLRVLIYVQDWEEAVVFKNGQIEYGFKRKPPNAGDFKWGWKKYKNTNFNKNPAHSKDGSNICRTENKCYLWWTAGQNATISFWSKDLIPGLGEDELSRFKDISIRFEFPEACHIPTDENGLKFFGDTYLRQQLDLMRMLIPKVRSRRAALRSAVSAIMGRNMSHNIGSHVLARYSSAAGRVSEQRTYQHNDSACESGVEDHRSLFLRYLQQRMDFIAEVATAEKSFWTQPLSLCEVLSALNLDAERNCINKENSRRVETRTFEPILLRYITGKEGINASVNIDNSLKRDDPYFACPGGEVGAHALYVILENIIRNSARHNKEFEGELVELHVEVVEAKKHDLWCVTIIDNQPYINNKTLFETVEEINGIISTEPILNQDGSPNPKYWGIREMQVCAHYLRGLPMSDLEGGALLPQVLEAFAHDNGDGTKCRLAYQIYLQRAKLCALICSEIPGPINENKGFIKSKGIEIFNAVPDSSLLKGYSHLVVDSDMASKTYIDETGNVELEFTDKKLIPLWQLPVRTCLVEGAFIEGLLKALPQNISMNGQQEKSSQKFNPVDWLEPVHTMIWERYRDRRLDEWKKKPVRALVGWEVMPDKIIAKDDCPDQMFCHVKKNTTQYNEFGSNILSQKQLGCAWVGHGNDKDFGKYESPNLLSAKMTIGDFGQPFVFAEILDSQSPHKPFLEKQRNKPNTGNELVAAALARVIVLDERVQNELQDQDGNAREYRSGILYETLWPCMGIWVPTKEEVDLNKPDFKKIQSFLNKPTLQPSQMPPDFLVLHLTILENIKLEDKCESETLKELLKGTSAELGCEIVIVTGRGVPSLSRHNGDSMILKTRYLPISALLGYLLARPSKLALMRALWSAAAAS